MSDKTFLSLTEKIDVCGYEIKKMPIGCYLAAIKTITEFPNEFLKACFGDRELSEVVEIFTRFDEQILSDVLPTVLATAPEYIISVVSSLTGIDKDSLINDENIGLDGLLKIIDAFIKVNNLGECASLAVALKAKIPKIRSLI